MARLSRLVALAIFVPLFVDGTAAAATTPPTSRSIGKQVSELKASKTASDGEFGLSVAIAGSVAVVGAPGTAKGSGLVYVFTASTSGWKQAAELKASSGGFFGLSVAIAGSVAVVGAPGTSKLAGRAYVFTKTSSGWTQTAELKGSDTIGSSTSNEYGDQFGGSVAISGTTIVIGAPGHAKDAGRAYVFTKTSSGWRQVAELKSAHPAVGGDLGDEFGSSVAISGTTVAVGAPDPLGPPGKAYVFTKATSGWTQAAELKAKSPAALDSFGASVAVSSTIVAVGDPGQAIGAGRAYVFTKTKTGWQETAELKANDTLSDDDLGRAVAVSGTTLVVGAPGYREDTGRAYVFAKATTGWKQTAELKGSDTAQGDVFGTSVAISNNMAMAGAPQHADWAGRAYVFDA